ncbi:hypothetical protein SAMN05428936_102173 [Pelagibacterium halotolerans]|nr:hypothetical protein SAMN05428936_102173 [Pelagibacterium halotolerans]
MRREFRQKPVWNYSKLVFQVSFMDTCTIRQAGSAGAWLPCSAELSIKVRVNA